MSNTNKTNNKTNTKLLTNSLPVKPAPDDPQEQDKDLLLIEKVGELGSWAKAGQYVGYSESYSRYELKYNKLNNAFNKS